MCTGLVDLGGRLWIIGIDILDSGAKIDEVLGEITKQQTHERLPRASISQAVVNMADETLEKQTWAEPAAIAQIMVRELSKTSVRVENLREGWRKNCRWKRTEIKTDLNRPKNETGLGSSSAGLATLRSTVVWSPEVMEAESCCSDFGLSQERGLFGDGEGLPFSSDDMLGRLGKGKGEVTRWHPTDVQLPSISILAKKRRRRPSLSRRGRLREKYLSPRVDAGRCEPG